MNTKETKFIILEHDAFRSCFNTSESVLKAIESGLPEKLRLFAESNGYCITLNELITKIKEIFEKSNSFDL